MAQERSTRHFLEEEEDGSIKWLYMTPLVAAPLLPLGKILFVVFFPNPIRALS